MWNDAELQHDVENEVAWDLRAGLTTIGVTVKGGAVQLGGHVESFWEKCAAERAAWRVAHVSHVTNEIRVVVPFNKQRDDDEIALAAMTILEWNCLVPETVEVQVAEACVTLSGSVERHSQKEEAARALCTLHGITSIKNEIVLQRSVMLGDAKADDIEGSPEAQRPCRQQSHQGARGPTELQFCGELLARAPNTTKRCTPLGRLPESPKSKITSPSALVEANSLSPDVGDGIVTKAAGEQGRANKLPILPRGYHFPFVYRRFGSSGYSAERGARATSCNRMRNVRIGPVSEWRVIFGRSS